MKARILALSIGFDVQKSKLVTEVCSSAVRSENGKNFTLFDKSFKNFISNFTCCIINMYFLNDRLFENWFFIIVCHKSQIVETS